MSWMVLITQIALPLVLLFWLAFFPAAGLFAIGLQVLSVGAFLLGIGLAALWTLPPYWTPYLYWASFAAIVFWHLLAGRFVGNGLWAATAGPTTLVLLAFGLGCVGGYMGLQAWQGRALPATETVDIAPPFASGTYLVAHGGSTKMVNIHLQTLDESTERFRPLARAEPGAGHFPYHSCWPAQGRVAACGPSPVYHLWHAGAGSVRRLGGEGR